MHTKFLSWLTLLSFLTAFTMSAVGQGTAAPGTTPPPAPAATAPKLGEIRASRVEGQVTVEDTATGIRTALVNGQMITQGTIVRTAEASSVVLVFSNGATVSLAFSSELNIEQFLQESFPGTYQPATATEEPSVSVTSIKLTRGELVGNVKKLKANQGSKFTVGTPVGAAGIRGTTFRIVYRPTGNGQAFNFVLTTVEGNIELATGTVTMPVSVTDNKEVIINEVTVNPTTNEVTVTTSTGATVTLAAPPPATDAPTTTVQQVTNVATQLAQTIVDVVITPPTTPAPPSTPAISSGTSGNSGSGGGGSENNQSGNNNAENQDNSTANNPNNANNANNSNTPNSNNQNTQGNLSGSQGNTTGPRPPTPGAGR